jgi:hypothetical protein
MVEGLTMASINGKAAGETGWVTEYIESRVERGKQWRSRIEDHKELAKASRYVRILGREVRAVSISDVNPCGHLRDKNDKKIDNCKSLTDAIAQARSATERKPGANKPEQRVQAFLIRSALQNELQFGRFHRFLPDFSEIFDELIFVTDELAVKPGEGNKECRADIVALGGKGGRFFPVFIELKNERLLEKLKCQLNNASKWLWKNEQARVPFAHFLSEVSGVPLEAIDQDETAARKMLIWPRSPSAREAKSVNEARQAGFLIVDFEPTYLFSRKTP